MRGYSTRSDVVDVRGLAERKRDLGQALARGLKGIGTKNLKVKSASLFYIRQTNGTLPDGRKIVFYFQPEFCYALDVGMPRLAILSVPYQIPTEPDGTSYRTIGMGDGEFPEFKEATVWSGTGLSKLELLYPATAGTILIGAKDGVTEAELAKALKGYVSGLSNQGSFYIAKVTPFDEVNVCKRIEAEVPLVKYAELDGKIRNNSGPWWVDRVL